MIFLKKMKFLLLINLMISICYCHKPLMGFSTWNGFKRDYNESVLKENVDLMVSLGLVELGYNYFNIDGEWWEAGYDKKVHRINKKITESKSKFPSGMLSFSNYVHNKGMKFGLYTSASTRSCFDKDKPMSFDFEKFDSKQFMDWKIDFIKIDSCGLKRNLSLKTLKKWRYLLSKNIIISNCRLGCYNHKNRQKWCSKKTDIYSMYRTSIDIKPTFSSIIYNIESITKFPFNPNITKDPDFLELGNGQLTFNEQISHISLWSITSSPLIISTDLRKLNKNILDLLKNKQLIYINQNNKKYEFKIESDKIIIQKQINNEIYLLIVNKSNKNITFSPDKTKKWKYIFNHQNNKPIIQQNITSEPTSESINPHSCLFIYSTI